MKKMILIIAVIVVIIAIAFLVGKYSNRLSTQVAQEDEKSSSIYTEEDWSKYKETPTERAQGAVASVVESTKQRKEVVGIITTLSKPNSNDYVYLEILASIVNLEGLNEVDFKKQSAELPMVQQVFKITVDETTKLKNVGGKDEITPGSMVRVVSGISVYEKQNFTAKELEVIAMR